MAKATWNSGIDKRMLDLIEQGHSITSTAIALSQEFAPRLFTRGAVVGRRDRLRNGAFRNHPGLGNARNRRPGAPPAPIAPAPNAPVHALRPIAAPWVTASAERRAPTPVVPTAPHKPASEGVPFNDLKRGQCRFELSDFATRPPDFRFCADPVKPGKPWCVHHSNVVMRRMEYHRKAEA